MKPLSILLVVIFWYSQGLCQLIEKPSIDLITVKDGLPTSAPTAIIQDKTGYIWISSVDGLFRYDGYNFKTYLHQPGDTNSIASNVIYTLAEDQEGNIWMGHLGGYISQLNPSTDKIKTFLVLKGKSTDVNKIYCDQIGTVWAAMRGEGLFKYNDQDSFDFVSDLPDLPKNSIREPKWFNAVGAFYQDRQQHLWLGTPNGLYQLDQKNDSLKKVEGFNPENQQFPVSVQTITASSDTVLWCGTYGLGLIKYNVVNGQWKRYVFQSGPVGTNNIINALIPKDDDELWIATSGRGFGVFNITSEQFSFYHEPEDFNTGPICYGLLKDRLNTVWSISDRGLFKWSEAQNQFSFTKVAVRKSDNGAYYGVTDLIKDHDDLIIGMNYTEGLAIIDKNKNISFQDFYRHPQGEPYLLVIDLFKDSKSTIWVSTRDAIYRLSHDRKLIKEPIEVDIKFEKTLPYFLNLSETSNGDLWVTSSRHGAFKKSAMTGQWEQITSHSEGGLKNNRVQKIIEDRQGNLWFFHFVEGITFYQKDKNRYTYWSNVEGDSTSLISTRITDVTQTSDGNIWIATVEGISLYDEKARKFSSFTTKNGLATNNVYSILADVDDNIWMTTSLGVTVFEKSHRRFRHFDFNDGLRGSASAFDLKKGENGKMYIVTYQGYYTFYPKILLNKKYPASSLVFTSIHGDFNRNSDGVIKVSYDQNKLTFKFASLNFLNPSTNKYSYFMDGLDKQWTTTSLHEVIYSGIPSGTYTFRVKNQKEEGANEIAVKVIVENPFWKERWFVASWLLLLMVTGYWLYRLRLSKIQQEAETKSEFNQQLAEVEMKALRAQMSPHFIFNSLNSINRYIVKSDPDTASLYLTKFSKLIRLILENSNHKIISLEQELSAIRLYIQLESLRFNHKFSYTLAVAPELNPISIGVPPMIIQPFVENAIWHGLLHKETPGQLIIKIEPFERGLQCIIQDDGIGRERAKELKSKSVTVGKSYGMKITAERLNMLNGMQVSSIDIEDMKDENGKATGTKVIIRIVTTELEPEF